MEDRRIAETDRITADPRRASGRAPSKRPTGRRFHGAIVQKLGTAILAGEHPPGTKLSGELAFSEALGISRSSFREAIQALTAKGLVESLPRAGTRVLPRNRWNLLDPEVLAWAFTGEPDMQLIRSLFELRGMIEPAAARLAAQRRDRDNLRQMKDALTGMRRHTLGTEQGRAADRDFHDAIMQATGNDALIVLSASIGAVVNWTTRFKQRSRALPRNPIPDHVRVYDAIAAEDPEAASKAMQMLVDLALEDTRASLD